MTAFVSNQVAASNAALLDAVYTFLTTNADLVTAGEEWTSLEYVAGVSFFLKGTGMGGTDEIFISWEIENDVPSDVYNIKIRGYTGYQAGLDYGSQSGASEPIYLCSYNQPLTYWIVANGRRFIVVEKVSTVYFSTYCGLFLPYASPTQYPYPLYIGASTYINNKRWSSLDSLSHAGFGCGITSLTSCMYFSTSGWRIIYGKSAASSPAYHSGTLYAIVSPFHGGSGKDMRDETRENMDGSYSVGRATIVDVLQQAIQGELEGFGWVTGFGNLAESLVNFDGDDWLVVQDVYRNSISDYYAVRLL